MVLYYSSSRIVFAHKTISVIIWLLILLSFLVDGAEFQPGVVAKEVIQLTSQTFDSAIHEEDGQASKTNPRWLLKFYAPWCGHCKHLAPILDEVAPGISGKLAIGKIDCTVEKDLCKRMYVRGYPTIKYTTGDGSEMFDYQGGRTAKDFITFAEKLAGKAITTLESRTAVIEMLSHLEGGSVIFLAHDPDMKGETTDEKLQSTRFAQIFAELAKQQKVRGSFFLLENNTLEEGEGEVVPSPLLGLSGAFLCRLEKGVERRCFDTSSKEEEEEGLTVSGMTEFFKSQNVPTVIQLGPPNFRSMARNGRRSLTVALVDGKNEEQVATAKSILLQYAEASRKTSASLEKKYYYGWMDAKTHSKYLRQFNVVAEDLPQLVVFDVPKKLFWQQATHKLNINDFLAAVDDGSIEPQTIGSKSGLLALLETLMNLFVDYYPWSVVFLIFASIPFGLLIFSVLIPAMEELRPPPHFHETLTTTPETQQKTRRAKVDSAPKASEIKDSSKAQKAD